MEYSYGFIKGEGEGDLFFHRNELEGVDYGSLREGQEVEYEIGQDSKGRPQAMKVRLAETQVDDEIGDSDGGDENDDSGGDGDG